MQGKAFGGLATSPPCPAFSTLRGSPGFKSKAADPWKQLFSAARSLQTPFVLIENVSGILAHLDIVKDVMQACGYRLASSRVCDLADFAPAKRSRWIGLFMRQHMTMSCPLADFYPRYGPKFIGLCHAVQPKEWPTEDLQIPEDVREILSNPVYMKGTKTPEQTWQKRLVKEYQTAPTFTHQYGNAWNLPHHTLLAGGLHCPILSPCGLDSNSRMFSPWEIARMHLLPANLVLPDDVLSAWQLLGNGVSPVQCILGFGMFMSSLGKATAEDLLRAIQSTMNDAVTFEGRIPVSRAGWQSLQLVVPPQTVPIVQDEGFSDVASDYSGRCYCNDPLYAGMEDSMSDSSPMGEGNIEVLTTDEPRWDPLAPPVTPQEWKLHGEMFKRIEAMQESEANKSRTDSATEPKERTLLELSSNHDVPDTLPWPPVSHHPGTTCSVPGSKGSLDDQSTQDYRTLVEYSTKCLKDWVPTTPDLQPLGDEELSPTAFDGSSPQEETRLVLHQSHCPQTASCTCELPLIILDHSPLGQSGFDIHTPAITLNQMANESSSQGTEAATDVTGTLAAPVTPPEAFLCEVPLTIAATQVKSWPIPQGGGSVTVRTEQLPPRTG